MGLDPAAAKDHRDDPRRSVHPADDGRRHGERGPGESEPREPVRTFVEDGDGIRGRPREFFWRIFNPSIVLPTLRTADLFALSFAVSHLVGYFVQQFIVGTGAAKIAGMIKKAGSVVDGLKAAGTAVETAVGAVKAVAAKAAKAAKAAAAKLMRGTSEAIDGFLKKIGVNWGDDVAVAVGNCVARFGAANSCYLDRLLRPFGKTFVESLHRQIGKWSQDLQGWVHRWADEFTNARGKRASELEGYLRYVEKHGDKIDEIRPHLNLGPDFKLKTGKFEDVKNYPNVPEFLFDDIAKADAAQHLRHLQNYGPTRIVYVHEMPSSFTDLLKEYGVVAGDILNGL